MWLLALTLWLVLWPQSTDAACTGSSPTWTSTADRTSVATCVTNAVSGDTINVDAGTQTWATAILLPAKDLTIIGATVITCSNGSSSADPVTCTATNNTNITCTTGACFTLPFTATHDISGFTFLTATAGGFDYVYGSHVNTSKHFRIHHNRIAASTWSDMQIVGGDDCVYPRGLVDHNILEDISIQPQGTDPGDGFGDGITEGFAGCMHTYWAQQPPLGLSDQIVTIESNHFQGNASNVNNADSNGAGRYVFRFNNITSGRHTVEIHGDQTQSAGRFTRGSQLTEVYENAASSLTGFSGSVFWRGGTGVAFNNRQDAAYSFGILFTNDRSELDEVIAVIGNCTGTSGADQNSSGQSGWKCRDQPGIGYDTTTWDHGLPPSAYAQVAQAIYLWGNLTAGSAMDVSVDSVGNVPTHIQANRDYYNEVASFTGATGVGVGTFANRPATCTTGVAYWVTDRGKWRTDTPGVADGRLDKCTSTNTWTAGEYLPWCFPHPLISGTACSKDANFGGAAESPRYAMFIGVIILALLLLSRHHAHV